VSSSFVQMFGGSGDEEAPEEHEQPIWHGPPEDELGVATPLKVVVGRSERAAVAVTQATSFTNGLTLSFRGQARELDRRTAQTLFHEQHPFGLGEEDLPDGFLRLGVELPEGAKASNIGGRPPFGADEREGPVFIHRGGSSGGHGRHDHVTMNHDYWIWPLPEPGTIRISCEWPLLGLSLSTVEIDGAELVAAAARVTSLWDAPSA
jgi:hypothetical protein